MPDIPKSILDQIARAVAAAMLDAVKPSSFLVRLDDMAHLVSLLDKVKPGRHVPDPLRQRIHDVISKMWDECKMLTDEDMDRIARGLDLVEAEENAKDATKQ